MPDIILRDLINTWLTDPVFAGTRLMAVVLLVLALSKAGISGAKLSNLSAAVSILFLGTIYISIILIMVEFFTAYFSGSEYTQYVLTNRVSGPYWWLIWWPVFFNIILPQTLLFKRFRTSAFFTSLILLPQLLILGYLWVLTGAAVRPGWHTFIGTAIYAILLTMVYQVLAKRKPVIA